MCALKMVLPHKRKRGRPRNDEPKDVKDFDLALIQEFRKRPAFFDRSHPQYRNREHLEPQWNAIAHTLGYNVPILKTRMMQLRNRYSLEKRRLETIKEQCGSSQEINSQWPLFNELHFLNGHIKGRGVNSQKDGADTTMQSSDSEDGEVNNASADNSLMNGFNSSVGRQSLNNTGVSQGNNSTPLTQRQEAAMQPRQSQRQQFRQQQLQIQREREKERQQAELELQHQQEQIRRQRQQQQQQQQQQQYAADEQKQYHNNTEESATRQNFTNAAPIKQQNARVLDLLHLSASDNNKYIAFGQFVSSSLLDLNECEALRLVDLFTSELVKSVSETKKNE